MKTLSIIATILFSSLFGLQSFAQTTKSETIKVWGNCEMCKKKIEKSAKSAGAITASWDADKLELVVNYDENKTTNLKIQQAVAKSGYDTQDVVADDKDYNKLPGCCKYERKAKVPGIINSNR